MIPLIRLFKFQTELSSLTIFFFIVSCVVTLVAEVLFDDDFALYFSAINLDVAVQKVQDAVNLASHWASIHDFKFSKSKTLAVHFCKTKHNYEGQIITYESFC